MLKANILKLKKYFITNENHLKHFHSIVTNVKQVKFTLITSPNRDCLITKHNLILIQHFILNLSLSE